MCSSLRRVFAGVQPVFSRPFSLLCKVGATESVELMELDLVVETAADHASAAGQTAPRDLLQASPLRQAFQLDLLAAKKEKAAADTSVQDRAAHGNEIPVFIGG